MISKRAKTRGVRLTPALQAFLLLLGGEALRRFFSLVRELALREQIIWLGGTCFALPQREVQHCCELNGSCKQTKPAGSEMADAKRSKISHGR